MERSSATAPPDRSRGRSRRRSTTPSRGVCRSISRGFHQSERTERMNTVQKMIAASVCSFSLGAGVMWAQQQQASHREDQFENDYMKVWKSTVVPKAPLALHRHDHGRALVALTDGVLQ